MRIQKIIHPGEKIPDYYGVSFHRYETNSIVCYPIPLNIIIGFSRNVFYRYLKTFRPTALQDMFFKMEQASDRKWQEHYIDITEMNLKREYQRGFDDGYKKRYEDALAKLEASKQRDGDHSSLSYKVERIGSKVW